MKRRIRLLSERPRVFTGYECRVEASTDGVLTVKTDGYGSVTVRGTIVSSTIRNTTERLIQTPTATFFDAETCAEFYTRKPARYHHAFMGLGGGR